MEYRKFGDTIVLRLEVGEEIAESLAAPVRKRKAGTLPGQRLGRCRQITVGVFDTEKKEYFSREYQGDFEIGSLTGNITRKEGKAPTCTCIWYSEIPRQNVCVAGHLNRAVISATAELFVRVLPGSVGRRMDDEVGLNLFQFSQDS